MYFWTYGLQKTWLDKCLKSPVSEDPLTSKTVNGPKHCSRLDGGTFIIFIAPAKANMVKKSLWLICKILLLFVNPLSDDNKYSLLNRENL